MYIFKLKLSEKARGYCMYVFLVCDFKVHMTRLFNAESYHFCAVIIAVLVSFKKHVIDLIFLGLTE